MTFQPLRRLLQTAKPPEPVRSHDASSVPIHHHDVQLVIGNSPDRVLHAVDIRSTRPLLVVPDCRETGFPGWRTFEAVTRRLLTTHAVEVAVPGTLSAADRQRLRRLTETLGCRAVAADADGWVRVEFGTRSRVLENADLAAELYGGAQIVALSAPTGNGTVALWNDFAHPNTSLRARVATNAVYDLALAVDAWYVLFGRIGDLWLAGVAQSALTAELLANGIERLRESQRGVEGQAPWEDVAIQHLAEIDDQVAKATNLALRVRVDDNAGERLASQLTELLGWRVVLHDANGGTSGG